ncbi:MAG TPA: cell division topological specificity factor MinE [Polyangiales bacterium]|jgi:cell division topological specificity factor|nr:cell division topological specificity factor MinE [Polyangiales bacterium]
MPILDFFRRRQSNTAQQAKDRLQIIVARERTNAGERVKSYLPKLQEELLAVIAKYERLDLDQVSVNLDRKGDSEVLEINIVLPQDPGPSSRRHLSNSSIVLAESAS